MCPSLLRAWATRPVCLWCLVLVIPVLAAGCSRRAKSAEHAEVSGTVYFQNKPLPGGRITFMNDQGFNGGTNIDENGKYTVSAPVGEVKITVDNRSLAPSRRGAPHQTPVMKRPGSEAPEAKKGTYVEIPSKYYSSADSPLKYTVTKGQQTHDVKLEAQ